MTASCDRSPAADPAPQSTGPPPTLNVEYAGCAEVLARPEEPGTVCVLPADRQLRLWVSEAVPESIWQTDRGVALTVDRSRKVAGGLLQWLTVPQGASRLELVLKPASRLSQSTVWHLSLAEPRAPKSLTQAAREGYKALNAGRYDLAIDRLTHLRKEQAAVGSRLAATLTAASVVYCYIHQSRFDAARSEIETFYSDSEAPAEARFQKSYYLGLIAMKTGEARTALQALDAAAELARRTSMDRSLGMALEMRATHLRQLGRAREAAAIFERLRLDETYDQNQDRARVAHNYAWNLLLAREAGQPSDVDPMPILERTLKQFDRGGSQLSQRINVRLNSALAHLHAGRLDQAEASLQQAAELTSEPPIHLRSWWLDVEARIAAANGRVEEALRLYDRMERLAAGALNPGGRRRAWIGRAKVLASARRVVEACLALETAERLLDEQMMWIPIQQGRETFVAETDAGSRLLIHLLRERGRPAEALATARRSRSRLLRSLQYRDRMADLSAQERRAWETALLEYHRLRAELDEAVAGDWQLSANQLHDARQDRIELSRDIEHALDRALAVFGTTDRQAPSLPKLRPGELTLVYHPIPQGWIGFAALGKTILAEDLQLPPLADATHQELADSLLAPFQKLIPKAERVRILAFGELRTVDFHALPLGDDILLAALPVVYGLDVPAPEPSLFTEDVELRALIVGDPQGDLPAAQREAERVHRALRLSRPPWTVSRLQGDEARAQAVIQGIQKVDLLHYAGHGVFSGRAGWGSTLPLADGSRLTLGDLLALPRAPARVVLSACETARVSTLGAEGLGLAHGFLLAGTRQVIAADRPVDDRAAADLVDALYRARRQSPDLADALRQAQLEQRRESHAAWASFRVLEP